MTTHQYIASVGDATRPPSRPHNTNPTTPRGHTMTVTALRTRQPTGKPSWPLILLAGEAKTGKTWRAAEFSGDPRIGRAYFLDLGEGCADEYGAVPGADYEIIDHNGTWVDIITQVEAVRDVAREALKAGENPVLLVIDSMTAEWAMLSQWTDARARRSKNNRKLLAEDPDAEIDITSNYWNDANSRHNRLMNILKFFPGIVVMTALETEKTQFGPGGRPLENAPKVAKPDGQKRLGADATIWVRLSLTEEPVVVGMRSVRHTVIPGKDKPKPWPGFTLGGLVFDFLGISAETAQVRATPQLDADQVTSDEVPDGAAIAGFREKVLAAEDEATLRSVWDEVKEQGFGPAATTDGDGFTATTLAKLATDRLANLREKARRASEGAA